MLKAFIVAALAALALAQQPFKSGAYTVAVYTTVTDPANRLVTDLPREAFSVLEDGKPQTITTFENAIQPITIVMMLDRSGSMRRNFVLVQKAGEAFVEQMLPADKARIGSFSNRIQVDPREFTGSKDALLEILHTELQEEGPTPLWNAVAVGMTALLHQEGRRVVLVFTDGMDSPGNGGSNNLSLKEVSKRADDEDVMVYAIGLAGNAGAGFGGGGGGYGRGGGHRGGGGNRRGFADKPDPGLEKLAAASGGGYFELTSTQDLNATFTRVAEELHHQYLLGFSPSKRDGKSHRLEVRVKGEGLNVRARKNYIALKGG